MTQPCLLKRKLLYIIPTHNPTNRTLFCPILLTLTFESIEDRKVSVTKHKTTAFAETYLKVLFQL